MDRGIHEPAIPNNKIRPCVLDNYRRIAIGMIDFPIFNDIRIAGRAGTADHTVGRCKIGIPRDVDLVMIGQDSRIRKVPFDISYRIVKEEKKRTRD
jgi:hypothetical protein